MKIHKLITSTKDLSALVSRMSAHDFVVVDTEFMRENTYGPTFACCRSNNDEAAAIDPKADGSTSSRCSNCWSRIMTC